MVGSACACTCMHEGDRLGVEAAAAMLVEMTPQPNPGEQLHKLQWLSEPCVGTGCDGILGLQSELDPDLSLLSCLTVMPEVFP